MPPNPFCFCTEQPRCQFHCRKRERRIQITACWIIFAAFVTTALAVTHYFTATSP